MIYIAMDHYDSVATGVTIEEAYNNFRDLVDSHASVDDLSFYEAKEIQVEMKITQKQVPVVKKPAVKKAPAAK